MDKEIFLTDEELGTVTGGASPADRFKHIVTIEFTCPRCAQKQKPTFYFNGEYDLNRMSVLYFCDCGENIAPVMKAAMEEALRKLPADK